MWGVSRGEKGKEEKNGDGGQSFSGCVRKARGGDLKGKE